MVCVRCQLVVKDEIERAGLAYEWVKMGEARLKEPVGAPGLEKLKAGLLKSGLEIIDDKKSKLVEKIKALIIQQVHYAEEPLRENFSVYIAAELGYDYTYLSNLFTAAQGLTLEHYIIAQKIEKVKELLVYAQLSLAEIAHLMNYSSAAHLSKQFKNTTGFTASHYKRVRKIRFEENTKDNNER